MTVVLDELADAGEARQRPRSLVPMKPAVLGVAERQVAVRTEPALVDERALRAIHRLERVRLTVDVEDEHVVAVVVPVAGLLPDAVAHEDRGRDLVVAVALLELAHRAFERPPDPLALRMPERGTRRDVMEAVQVELDAEPAVVALLRLGAPPEVAVQLLLRRPDRAIDPLEHRSRPGRRASRHR